MRAHSHEAARLLRALGNDNRLLILCLLVDGEMSVGEINARIDLAQPALSQHLAVLREESLLETRRAGQTIYYTLPDGPARALVATLHRLYCGPRAPEPAAPEPRAQSQRRVR